MEFGFGVSLGCIGVIGMRKRIQGFGCLSVQFRAYSAEGSRV